MQGLYEFCEYIVVIPLYWSIVCLATSRLAFFMRRLRLAHFLIFAEFFLVCLKIFADFMPLLLLSERTILLGTEIPGIIKNAHYDEKHTYCLVVFNIYFKVCFSSLLILSVVCGIRMATPNRWIF